MLPHSKQADKRRRTAQGTCEYYRQEICHAPNSDMKLPNLPLKLPDESLYSLAAHIRLANGLGTDRAACAVLFGKENELRVGDSRVNLDTFCNATKNRYGSRDEVVHSTTTRPFFQHIGNHPNCMSPFVAGNYLASHYPLAATSGLASLSTGHPCLWRWCPTCRSEDLSVHGTAYWRRSQLLPGVGVCTRHGDLLVEVHIPYERRQQHFILPDSVSILEYESKRDHSRIEGGEEAQFRLARLAESILHDSSPQIPSSVSQAVILDGLSARGFITKNGNIRKDLFAIEMGHYCQSLAHLESFRPFIIQGSLLRLARDLVTVDYVRFPIQFLLLIDWLFGSWSLFREQCAWRRIMDNDERELFHMQPLTTGGAVHLSSAPNSAPTRTNLGKASEKHRSACLTFTKERPTASRTDFWRANQKSCRWLTQYDALWIDKQLPTITKIAQSQSSFSMSNDPNTS